MKIQPAASLSGAQATVCAQDWHLKWGLVSGLRAQPAVATTPSEKDRVSPELKAAAMPAAESAGLLAGKGEIPTFLLPRVTGVFAVSKRGMKWWGALPCSVAFISVMHCCTDRQFMKKRRMFGHAQKTGKSKKQDTIRQ